MNTPKTALFPGSFDPITLGHENIVRRALPLFDKIVIAIGRNTEKSGMFPVETRRHFIEELFRNEPKVEVAVFSTMTVEYCRSIGAGFLLRGLRTAADFEYERTIGLANKTLSPELETVFLLTDNRYDFISSSVVRDVLHYGGSPSAFLPECVCRMIREYMS